MAGTTVGGRKASETNKQRYGDDFYKRIGLAGGKKSRNVEWAASPEGQAALSRAGTIGGKKSRKNPPEHSKPKSALSSLLRHFGGRA